MTKKNFVTLILSTVGGILFAVGMCMTMVVEWHLFRQGVVAAAAGAAVLLIMAAVRRKMAGKPVMVKPKAGTVGKILLAVCGALTLGAGMCMTMVPEGMMLRGILVGIVGIILLLCLIPACRGLKREAEGNEN